MKPVALLNSLVFLALVFACNKPAENTQDTITEIPEAETLPAESLEGEWHMVTEVDGEWVLFYPCDADNTFIQIQADSIVIGWGQDATAGKIESWSNDGNKLTLAVNDSYAVNTYQVNTGLNGYTEWWLWEDAEKPSRFIHARNKAQYKEVRQPCKECWEDCEEE
ncbi:MAG: hypothetical protein DYG99_01520 [Bacteroidetes bacterium CHB5]|nr:hypothetical protein [Bacteroidetes bacterium CHB5]